MKTRLLALSSVFALLLTACQAAPSNEAPQEPIKIGYIGPLTGGAAGYGNDTFNAAQMKVDEVNAKGGINGHTIKLIAEDARCTGSDAASAAQKLISIDKVVAIIGGQCSGETLAAAPISEAAKIVQISPVSSSPDITEAGDFIFRTIPSDALKGVDMANYFAEQGYKKVAILTENTDYAVGIRNSLKAALSEGSEVVFDEVVEPETKDFRTLFARLQNIEFDVFVPNPQVDGVLAAMMEQFREQGFTQPAVSQDIADSTNLGKIATEAVEGMRMFNTSSLLGTKAQTGEKSFAEKFMELHGDPQSNMSFATLSYDSTGVLLQAVAAVGTDGEAIRDYLYNLREYKGAAGGFHFDENGDVVGIRNVPKEFQNGTIVEVIQ